jgi:hypothetical protein
MKSNGTDAEVYFPGGVNLGVVECLISEITNVIGGDKLAETIIACTCHAIEAAMELGMDKEAFLRGMRQHWDVRAEQREKKD